MDPNWWRSWVLWCALAELLGIGAAALHYLTVLAALGEPEPLAQRLGVWLLASLAAVPEGVILGGIQAWRLGQLFPGLSRARFVAATIAVGLVGWGIGTAIPLFLLPGEAAGAAPPVEPPAAAVALYAALFGVAAGLLFGLVQAAALPPAARPRWRWVAGCAAGWALGLPLIYLAAGLGADIASWPLRLAVWALGGLGAGLMVGLATRVALAGMVRAPAQSRAGAPQPAAG